MKKRARLLEAHFMIRHPDNVDAAVELHEKIDAAIAPFFHGPTTTVSVPCMSSPETVQGFDTIPAKKRHVRAKK
jgi:hypothetical protein